MNNGNNNIQEAKRLLPLPKLMAEMGYGDRAKKSARCLFHDDHNPSFSVFEKDGQWFFKCHSCGAKGDEIDFLAKLKFGGDIKQALPEFLRMAGVTNETVAPAHAPKPKQAEATEAKPAPVRPRIAKVAAPSKPVTLEQWCDAIAANFPALARPAEVCLSVIAQLLLNDVSNPFALALVDVPSSGKTITLNFFSGIDELTYTSDSFTPAAFVSHASNVKREDLDKVDLLPRIQYRTLIVREMGAMFGANDDDLRKSFGVFTRVLDGEGLETDSGVHGQRGYKGDYVFMMLGGTPPIAPRVFKVMGNFGSRLFFLALHMPDESEDSLIDQNRGQDRKQRESDCQAITDGFLRTLWADNPNGVIWNKADDPEECLRVIARCARLLAALRAPINVWPIGDDGEKLTHSIPIIEKPNRINCLLYNLARAHALIYGRRQLANEDLWPVLDLTYDSAPPTRAKVFRKLIEAGGTLTTSDVEKLLCCSPPTARKEMEALLVLGIVEKTECPGATGRQETHITLDSRFEWFTSDECKALLNTHRVEIFSRDQASCNVFADVKENSPYVCVPGGGSVAGEVATKAATAHNHLAALAGVLQLEAKDGLHPAGHSDCPWGENYPEQYTSALDYLRHSWRARSVLPPDKEKGFQCLRLLLHKIESEAKSGRPLCSPIRAWCDDGYPPEYHAAKAHVAEKMAQWERELMSARRTLTARVGCVTVPCPLPVTHKNKQKGNSKQNAT
jgi:hypothetical protein